MRSPWTKEEENYLIENYNKYNCVKKAADSLKFKFKTKRSYASIATKASKLGLGKCIYPNFFSMDEIIELMDDKSNKVCIRNYVKSIGMQIIIRHKRATISHECADMILQYFKKPDEKLWMSLSEFRDVVGYANETRFRELKKYNIQHLKYKDIIYVPRKMVDLASEYMSKNSCSYINWSYIKENLKRVDCNPLHEVK